MNDDPAGRLKQEFDLHIGFLTETNKAFVDNTGKVAGFLLLALGWLATSEDAREYLASTPQIAKLAALAVAVTFLLYTAASLGAYRRSRDSYVRLVDLAYLPESAFKARKLGLATSAVCVVGTAVLACLLVALLASIAGVCTPP